MKFTIVENTQQAAIYINKMDNNFPERVKDIVFILDKMKQVPIITLEDILKAHRYLIKRFGIYDILISDDIRGILPVGKPEIFQSMNQSGCDYLIAWYKAFQEIHPFKKGTQTMGGIILSALSYNPRTQQMLVSYNNGE